MTSIFNYWMEISKEVSKKTKNTKGDIWDWENHKDDIAKLKHRLQNTYIDILGTRIDLTTGKSNDLVMTNEYTNYNYTMYLFHYSKAKDVGNSNKWVKYYDLMTGLSKGVEPFQNNVEEITILFDKNENEVITVLEQIGGKRANYGDLSYILSPLPNIQILFIYHRADDEFASELTVLFDENIINYLPPELIWGIMSHIAYRVDSLIKYRQKQQLKS